MKTTTKIASTVITRVLADVRISRAIDPMCGRKMYVGRILFVLLVSLFPSLSGGL